METIVIVVIVLLLIWITYGYFSSRVKEPKFTILKKKNGYEIRKYASYIEARVTVKGEYREAMSAGFRILAGYIFGGNLSRQSITMTTPVIEQKSQVIAMTAPVSEVALGNSSREIAFVMPEEYTLATLPVPNDKRIEIVEVKEHKSAALRYSGYNTSEKVSEMKTSLLKLLKQDSIVPIGEPRSAGYNPPWTPPYMRRNEILVNIFK